MNDVVRHAEACLVKLTAEEIARAIGAQLVRTGADAPGGSRAASLASESSQTGQTGPSRPPSPVQPSVPSQGERAFTSFAIDSRRVAPGALFFAIRGPNRDGHDYLGDAVAAGARGLVVSRDPGPDLGALARGRAAPSRESGDGRASASAARKGQTRGSAASGVGPLVFVVPDTTRALQDLAARARAGLALVVGITGSAGKTTAKEMTAAVLERRRPTGRTAGNLNNLYGLPLSLLNLPEDTKAAVLEMGMSSPGEIARLVEIADPDVGVILNIGEAHLGNFGSIDEIAEAKGELYRCMRRTATAVWNAADPRVRRLADAFSGPKVSFAVDTPADLVARDIEDDIVGGVRFRLRARGQDHEVRLSLFGAHNVQNALAALGVACALGNDLAGAVRTLAGVRAAAMRGETIRLGQGIVLVDDTYNSNPAAMASVLSSLAVTAWAGRKVLIAGDMLELGATSAHFHRQAGEHAARAGVGLLVAVGTMANEMLAGASRLGAGSLATFENSAKAAGKAASLLLPGDLVLVKGSRGMAMETFVQAAKAAFGDGRG